MELATKTLRESFDDKLTGAASLLARRPHWSDEQIALRAEPRAIHLPPFWVSAIREYLDGAVNPGSGHRDIVYWCYKMATVARREAHFEVCYGKWGNGAIIVDVVLGAREAPSWLIEIKPAIKSQHNLVSAVGQIRRYRQVVGSGRMAVAAPAVAPGLVGPEDVPVWTVAQLAEKVLWRGPDPRHVA